MLGRRADPIAAIASAPGKGAVGVVRVSGAGLAPLALALTGKALRPRHAHYGPLLDASGAAIDHGLALFFPAPHSYTGEDVLELQAHGGPVVLQLLLARCLEAGAPWRLRLAEPGEFTERAFLNDKLDLVQAEAVADLIDASTEAGARSAARSLGGAFSAEVGGVAERIVALRMLVEATLDFPEEEIDFLEQADARGKLAGLCAAVASALARARQGALLRDGLRVVLAGQPNVGKSSLLNALAGAELAIVTPIAGTTRDRVSETVQIEGVPIHLTDTAGLRPPGEVADEVERIGVARSWESIHSADAVVFLHDLTRMHQADYQAAESEIEARLAGVPPGRLVHVYNKADALAPPSAESRGSRQPAFGPAPGDSRLQGPGIDALPPPGALSLSARTGAGLDALRRALLERAGWQPAAEGTVIARERHVRALQATAVHLALATAHADQADRALDLLAEELRLAHASLQELTGRFSADDLLGEIFSRFCIGK